MQFTNTFISILLSVVDLALPSLAADTVKTKNANPNTKPPIQGRVEKKGKFRQPVGAPINPKTGSAYSISRPYNPNNPPPTNDKIHPVSSNAR